MGRISGRFAGLAAAAVLLGPALVQVTTAGPAAAISGEQIVSTRSAEHGTGGYDQDAVCPAGLQVIGGGGYLVNGGTVLITASYPLDDRTWRLRAAKEPQGGSSNWSMTAYAICVPPLDGWEIKWGGSGPGVGTFKTTYTFGCSKGRKAISAGGRVQAPDGTVGLTLIRPDSNLSMGRASARVGHFGYSGSWYVDSFAICAVPPPGLAYTAALTWATSSSMSCPDGKQVVGVGGGGGLVDLGPYYLSGLSLSQNIGWLGMTGVGGRPGFPDEGGAVIQLTCANW